MHVHFVLTNEATPLAALERLDPDRDWQQFVTTTCAWILQTYLRLRAAGCPVSLTREIPQDGIAVVSTGDYHAILRNRALRTRALIVATRGSYRRTPWFADVAIVHNRAQADGVQRLFMTHWPQPALLPRRSERGAAIKRIAHKGFPANFRHEFREPRWRNFLHAHGIDWIEDSADYANLETDISKLQWPDYRDVDLILAVREPDPKRYPGRPATKLYNAWLAAVPALLGPELAYRAERSHPDDYIEVNSVADAEAAVQTLLEQPQRYLALVARARARAQEFTVQATTRRWQRLLFEELAERTQRQAAKRGARSLAARQLTGCLRWAFAKR
jgi:hypothetical protein